MLGHLYKVLRCSVWFLTCCDVARLFREVAMWLLDCCYVVSKMFCGSQLVAMELLGCAGWLAQAALLPS